MDDLLHCHLSGTDLNPLNLIAGTDLARLQNTDVKPNPFACQKTFDKFRIPHFDAKFKAGHTRLGDFNPRVSHSKNISDMNGVLKHPFHSEVFAELPVSQIILTKLTLPVVVVRYRVNVDGFVDSAVHAQIALSIAICVFLVIG